MTIPVHALVDRIRGVRGDNAPAFIIGVESNGLSFLRSLGRRGIPVVALDSWRNPGMYSRYCISSLVPAPGVDEVGLLRLLQEMGEAAPARGALIATGDAYALFVSRYCAELGKHYDFNVADYDTMLTAANKRLQYEFAQRQGVETPLTLFPGDQDIEEISSEIDYPCIIKPYFSHLWRHHPRNRWGKVAVAHSGPELVDAYSEMKKSGLDFMVQQRISGGDDQLYGLITYLDRSSEPLAIFTKRKLRQFPRYFGDGSIHLSVWAPEVADLGLGLLRGLNFRGMAHVEFKRDPQDGRLKLMEINPRSSAATYHAVVSGVDIPYIAYRDSIGKSTEKALTFHDGVKWIDFEKDFKSFLESRRDGNLDLGVWLKSWRGNRCFAYFAWDDPLPACLGFGTSLWATFRGEGLLQ